MSNFPVVIHHNPGCGTSRNVLRIIEAAGYAPTVIDYVAEGWTRPQLLALFAAAGVTAREALREKNTPAADLGLLDPAISDDQLIAAMIEHPSSYSAPSWPRPAVSNSAAPTAPPSSTSSTAGPKARSTRTTAPC